MDDGLRGWTCLDEARFGHHRLRWGRWFTLASMLTVTQSFTTGRTIHVYVNDCTGVNMWQDGVVNNIDEAAASEAGQGPVSTASNAEALRALADPLRLRILSTLMQRDDGDLPVMSVKELAADLGEPQTKLYRHVKHLESAGLVKAAASRIVPGIVEQRYQATQPEIVIGDAFTEQEKVSQEAEGMTAAAFELYRRQFFAARRAAAADSFAPQDPEPLLGISDGRLPAARAVAIREQLYRIFEEITAARLTSGEAGDSEDLVPVSM